MYIFCPHLECFGSKKTHNVTVEMFVKFKNIRLRIHLKYEGLKFLPTQTDHPVQIIGLSKRFAAKVIVGPSNMSLGSCCLDLYKSYRSPW